MTTNIDKLIADLGGKTSSELAKIRSEVLCLGFHNVIAGLMSAEKTVEGKERVLKAALTIIDTEITRRESTVYTQSPPQATSQATPPTPNSPTQPSALTHHPTSPTSPTSPHQADQAPTPSVNHKKDLKKRSRAEKKEKREKKEKKKRQREKKEKKKEQERDGGGHEKKRSKSE